MIRRSFIVGLGILWLGITPGLGPGGRAEQLPASVKPQAPATAQDGVEVLARGPVHEAFAEPTIRAPAPAPVVAREPPKPIGELPPDQKPEGADVQWIPGYWAWNDDTSDFLWVSGTYRAVPPGRQWTPGYWNQAKDGWQWVVGYWADQQRKDVELLPAPPDPVEQAVPPEPADPSIFQPGGWVYRDNRYLWRPGFWTPYRVGWTWTPAGYVWTPGGYVASGGYWDRPLRERGLLFAPVNVERRYWNRPDWSYQPSYVIRDDFLLAALFVRPSHHRYYFGDYFDRGYDRQGFVPWTDFRFGRSVADPLFTNYRWQYRDNPGWSRDQQRLYGARR